MTARARTRAPAWACVLSLCFALCGCKTHYERLMRSVAGCLEDGETAEAHDLLATEVVDSDASRMHVDLLRLEQTMTELAAGRLPDARELSRLSERLRGAHDVGKANANRMIEAKEIEPNWLENAREDWAQPFIPEEYELITCQAVGSIIALLDGRDADCKRLADDSLNWSEDFGDPDRGEPPRARVGSFLRGVCGDVRSPFTPSDGVASEFFNFERGTGLRSGYRPPESDGADRSVLWVLLLTGRGPHEDRSIARPDISRIRDISRQADRRTLDQLVELRGESLSAKEREEIINESFGFKVPELKPKYAGFDELRIATTGGSKSATRTASAHLVADFAEFAVAAHNYYKDRRLSRIHFRELRRLVAERFGEQTGGRSLLSRILWPFGRDRPKQLHRFWLTMPERLYALRLELDAGVHEIEIQRRHAGRAVGSPGKTRIALRAGTGTVLAAYIYRDSSPIRFIERRRTDPAPARR